MESVAEKKSKTVVAGASTNPTRYAYLAAQMLQEYGYDFVPVGIKKGELFGQPILDFRELPKIDHVDTVTLYIGPDNQKVWYDYLISLKPRRVIFNPGTENFEFAQRLKKEGIEVTEACTLVLLRSHQY